MKLLKISFAVLLFSFLGSMNNQVLAQDGPEGGSWTRTFRTSDSLVNGDFGAKIELGTVAYGNKPYSIKICKAGQTYPIRRCFIIESGSTLHSLSFKQDKTEGNPYYPAVDNGMYIATNSTPAEDSKSRNISLKSRKGKGGTNGYAGWVLDDTVEATDSAYFQLESDGTLVIYSGTGGKAIVRLDCK
jgi:hypothetical protein